MRRGVSRGPLGSRPRLGCASASRLALPRRRRRRSHCASSRRHKGPIPPPLPSEHRVQSCTFRRPDRLPQAVPVGVQAGQAPLHAPSLRVQHENTRRALARVPLAPIGRGGGPAVPGFGRRSGRRLGGPRSVLSIVGGVGGGGSPFGALVWRRCLQGCAKPQGHARVCIGVFLQPAPRPSRSSCCGSPGTTAAGWLGRVGPYAPSHVEASESTCIGPAASRASAPPPPLPPNPHPVRPAHLGNVRDACAIGRPRAPGATEPGVDKHTAMQGVRDHQGLLQSRGAPDLKHCRAGFVL